MEINPRYAGAYSNLGVAYYLSGDIANAIAALKKATDIEPTLPGPFYNTACIYGNEKKAALAVKYLHEAVDRGFNRVEDLERDERKGCFQAIKSDRDFLELKRLVGARKAALPIQ